MKDDAVPTIFNHTNVKKHRISSVHREENQAKKICIDEALIEYDDAVEEESPIDLEMVTSCDKVDKAIDNVPKMKSVRTQYNVSHFGINKNQDSVKNKPLMVTIFSQKKMKDVEVNTFISFDINDEVAMVKKPEKEREKIEERRQYLQKLGSQLTEELDDMSDVN